MSAPIPLAPEVSGRWANVRYEESTKGCFWFIVKGVILTFLTVGIYRFWFVTNVRKNLWGRVFIDGSPAEYTGKAHELLLGFLVALAILLPVYIVVFVATMYSPYPMLGVVVGYGLFFLLVQFARFRARRYLVSRTVWRGIRFRQDGSALVYTALAAGWWLATLLTLGLAYPFMRASLERYRMSHTLLGDTRFVSEASGLSVLLNWVIVYALTILPILGCIGVLLTASKFRIPTIVFDSQSLLLQVAVISNYYSKLISPNNFHYILVITGAAIVLRFICQPYYKSREFRAFLCGIRLGGARMSSRLSAADIYINLAGFYLSVAAIFVIFFIAIMGLSGAVVYLGSTELNDNTAAAFAIPNYAVCILGISWFRFCFLQVGRLAVIGETLSITGADTLDALTATTRKVEGRLAEGMADAVDPGGIEIGF